MIITIDGPAGSGKSTAARRLAKRLGIAFLDTGATYRAVTLKALREKTDMSDEKAMATVAVQADIQLLTTGDEPVVMLDGQDVSNEIRTPQVSEMSRFAATSPMVREVLVKLQQRLGASMGSFVTEGRDQGTVVFPEAQLKVYLDADAQERARRRHTELRQRGHEEEYDEVLKSIIERDARDKGRAVGPLAQAPDAVVINTTGMEIEQVEQKLVELVEAIK